VGLQHAAVKAENLTVPGKKLQRREHNTSKFAISPRNQGNAPLVKALSLS
jgi:hypothetical protein